SEATWLPPRPTSCCHQPLCIVGWIHLRNTQKQALLSSPPIRNSCVSSSSVTALIGALVDLPQSVVYLCRRRDRAGTNTCGAGTGWPATLHWPAPPATLAQLPTLN